MKLIHQRHEQSNSSKGYVSLRKSKIGYIVNSEISFVNRSIQDLSDHDASIINLTYYDPSDLRLISLVKELGFSNPIILDFLKKMHPTLISCLSLKAAFTIFSRKST